MSYIFLALAGIIAVIDWLAVARGWRRVELVAKPGTMLALIAFVITSAGLPVGLLWLVLGLLFSLAGDVFLMLDPRLFIFGLVAFLLAHVSYIVGFDPIPPFKFPHYLVAALIVVLVAVPASQVYRRVAAGMQVHGHPQLKIPALFYILAISLMVISALFTMLRNSWLPFNAVAVSAGALSFLISDSILSWDRFVTPLPSARLWTMITYHLAQFLIVLGATLQFLSK